MKKSGGASVTKKINKVIWWRWGYPLGSRENCYWGTFILKYEWQGTGYEVLWCRSIWGRENCRVAQPWQCWHFGPDNSFSGAVVLYIGCLFRSIPGCYPLNRAAALSRWPQLWQPKFLQRTPPGGQNCVWNHWRPSEGSLSQWSLRCAMRRSKATSGGVFNTSPCMQQNYFLQ